jgi:hypothetical protein
MQLEVGGHSLKFFDCLEVCQGGPEACSLIVDGWLLKPGRFDPSPLLFEETILLPMRKISFFKSGYVLVRIDPRASTIKTLSKIHGYMKLKAIEGRTVEFATSAWGDDISSYTIP